MIISIKELKKFTFCVLIPLLLGYLSYLLSRLLSGVDMNTYYYELIKPVFAPPAIIFPIVWNILYVLMGISCYLILSHKRDEMKIRDSMFYYWLQLGLNFLWSILFFGFQLRLTALIDLIILIVIVVIMIKKFKKIKPVATYINIPYLLWLLYAFILNYFIWFINK
ncbi:MAG: TspO/MBR family protein [Terrisporobacter sp.]|uniref:TspO/MBR family protein n=1 Tax=Terrisporobacter sp. TaxID=1965305 RepID=UPI002FC8172F